MANRKNLLLLFDRPTEPVFVAKGENKTVFEVPERFLTDRYKPIGVELFNRFGEDASERVPVRAITLPNFNFAYELGRREPFSLFINAHRKLAGRLIDVFMGMRNIDELQSAAVFCRDRINPFLFNYALSVAILHRPDTQGLDLPTLAESFPEKFIDSAVFSKAREEAAIVQEGQRNPIEIPRDYTASDLEPEHRVAYFREDLGINLHHWHWHLVYPFEAAREIVAKDRRGELFYYMHQQIMARYNGERLCNQLARVKRFSDWKAPIEEGYFPKLDSLVASRSWPARVGNSTITDVNRSVDQISQAVDDLIRWRDRILEAIHSGFVRNERGENIELTEMGGIDILGDIFESSILSVNRNLYGDLHNMGHVFIAYCHDPDHRHLESFGVIGDSATAMRDPAFYRWHAFVDDIFQTYKSTIPRYSVNQLEYQGITIPSVQITSEGGSPNMLNTFWQQSDVDLSRGMDFSPRGAVMARFTHLQHTPFTYNIQVNNTTNATAMGTCRIFIAPKFDERGLPMLFRDQKLLFIELDKFTVTLNPGNNNITQRSDQSSVTIPFERTFRNLDLNRPVGGDELEVFNFCGCGWPQHMLIPKGNAEGFPCELFVMISNYADDVIQQDINSPCNDAASYCGIKDRLYPDRRSMGYPFDRMPRDGVDTLQQFITPNMNVQDVTIQFTDRTVIRDSQ